MTHTEIILRSRDGEPLRCDIRYRPTGKAKPVVLFVHGFKGFKDWGPFPYVRERLAEAGFVAVGFNFSHNGVGEDLHTFSELDRFARNTFTRDLHEIEDILEIVSAKDELPIEACEIDSNRIILFGHSRGASEAILSGADTSDIRAVVAWAPVATFHRYSERQKQIWREQGYFEIENARTGQIMRLNVSLLDDIEQHAERLDIPAHATHLGELGKPLLVIAGSEDLTAPVKESQEIAAAYGPSVKLTIIERTGHTFGAEQPYRGSTLQLEQAIDETIAFMQHSLGIMAA
ncbi:MAG: alpha/beta fold hydrolase [Bacteroidetes bacterium]|nr:alpha/beta fold hydrolase [Bacteroidota bacterium]